MSKSFILFILLLPFLIFGQTDNQEWRSTWVVTWEYINSGSSVETNKARCRQILDNHVTANMNAVLWQARQSGTAYYNSSYEPWGYYAGNSYPGYDPLQYAIEQAHARGLELHAWFNVFHVSSTVSGTIANLHPEWICTNEDGEYMTSYRCASPGIADVREYTVNVAMEIVRNYDIDGLHLDFIRWNEYDEDDMGPNIPMEQQISLLDGEMLAQKESRGDNPEGYKRYIYDSEHPKSGGVPTGFNNWDDWRRWGVTEFVKTLHDSIQAVKPWVRLSPAALGKYRQGGSSGWNGYYVVFQDAALWFDEGYIDQMTPMHYHWTTGSGFTSVLGNDWSPYIQNGLAAGRLYSVGPGSYILSENDLMYRHTEIVNTCRNVTWVDGFQFFSYGTWRDHAYFDDARDNFFTQLTKVRPIYTQTPPEAPTVALNKVDSLLYEITVTPDQSINSDHWYAIYRSEDDQLDVTEDQIINIAYGWTPYSYFDDFSDAAFYAGTYHYFATTFDRFWNESDVSNSVESDVVNVLAPVPATPSVIGVTGGSATSLLVMCEQVDYADGYTALVSIDGVNFTDSTTSSTNNIVVEGLTENVPYYFRIRAYNQRGWSAVTDKLFAGVPSAGQHKTLVVNGFDRSTNTRYDYVKYYADPLKNAGAPFSYTLNEMVSSGQVTLTGFQNVIWILGDESTADDTFDPDEQDKVKEYLNAGGNLFVSGAEIGWDLEGKSGHPTSTDIYFYNNYLKAKYVDDAPGGSSGTYYTCTPIFGEIFDGLADFNFDDGTHGTIDIDWPDAIDGYGGGENILNYASAPASSNVAGVKFKGVFPSGTSEGALVYLAFPFETVYPTSARNNIMQKVFEFFGQPSGLEEINSEMPEDYKLFANYPNPFNPATKIRFAIPEQSNVKLTIFNSLGQVVKVLADEEMSAGTYELDFNASGLASGIYFYNLRAGVFSQTNKMMLLK